MNERLKNAVGLAMRAGKCVSGQSAVEKCLQAGGAKLLILDETASKNAADRAAGLSRRWGVPLLRMPEAGKAIGNQTRMILAITDTNFVNLINGAVSEKTGTGAASGVDADGE